MNPFEQYLVDDRSRDMAIAAIRLCSLTDGLVCVIAPETRSQAQNRLMWPKLQAISRHVVHFGRKLGPEDWKNLFMGALANADFVPSLDGHSVVPLGLSTRALGKRKFGELLDLIDAFMAEKNVPWPALHEAAPDNVVSMEARR